MPYFLGLTSIDSSNLATGLIIFLLAGMVEMRIKIADLCNRVPKK